jgi:glycosyltransferase involved in cell wall biosynthesis
LYSNASGGSETQFLKLYKLLPKIDVDYDVVFLKDADVHNKIEWRKPPLTLRLSSLRNIFSLFTNVSKLKKYIKKNKIDTLHTLFDDSALIGAILKILQPGLTLVSSQRNMGYSRSKLRKIIQRLVFRISDFVVVNAEVIKESLVREYSVSPGKIVVIRNILDQKQCVNNDIENDYKQYRKNYKYISITVANLRAIKGIDDLLLAIKRLDRKYNVLFLVLGGGDKERNYLDLIEEYKITDRVKLLGYQNDINCYLKYADLAILPSRSEGASNSLIEYMMAGLPIIATDAGGNNELLNHGECGKVVPPHAPKELSDAIADLLDNYMAARDMGMQARLFAEEVYEQDKILSQYQKLYSGNYKAENENPCSIY